MKRPSAVWSLLVFFLMAAGALSAQSPSFFPNRVLGTFQVQFSSNVEGTMLSVDNQPAGILPMTLYVAPGPHLFTWQAPGGNPKSLTYPVMSDTQIPFTTTVSSYPLNINVNVPVARIFLDNRPVSNRTSTTPGNHVLRVVSTGYQEYSLNFNQPTNEATLNVNLLPLGFPLTVNVNVSGASISLDGQPAGGNPLMVSPGNHTLQVVAPGYQVYSLPFQMPGNATTFNVNLLAQAYQLTINVNAPNATFTVDGQPVNNPAQVSPGVHTVQILAPGYQPASMQFPMPANSTTLNINLKSALSTVQLETGRFLNKRSPGVEKQIKVFVNKVEQSILPLQLAPGTYTIRIEVGPVFFESSLNVVAGQNYILAPYGAIEIR